MFYITLQLFLEGQILVTLPRWISRSVILVKNIPSTFFLTENVEGGNRGGNSARWRFLPDRTKKERQIHVFLLSEIRKKNENKN